MSRLLIVLFPLAFCHLTTAVTTAQCINGTKTYPIYKAGADQVRDLDEAGKEIVHVEYDLVFDSKDMYRTLSPDWTYTITAFADDGVKDLDIAVLEYDDLLEEWTVLLEDKSTSATPSIEFIPAENKEYLVRVTVASWNEGYTAARYGLFLYHD